MIKNLRLFYAHEVPNGYKGKIDFVRAYRERYKYLAKPKAGKSASDNDLISILQSWQGDAKKDMDGKIERNYIDYLYRKLNMKPELASPTGRTYFIGLFEEPDWKITEKKRIPISRHRKNMIYEVTLDFILEVDMYKLVFRGKKKIVWADCKAKDTDLLNPILGVR